MCAVLGCARPVPCADHPQRPWAGSRRARRVGSGSRSQKHARFVMLRDGGICHWCGKPGADQVDHVVPVAEGGADTVGNKAPIHARPCHLQKTQQEAQRGRGVTPKPI